jgi:hypothetical protein
MAKPPTDAEITTFNRKRLAAMDCIRRRRVYPGTDEQGHEIEIKFRRPLGVRRIRCSASDIAGSSDVLTLPRAGRLVYSSIRV